MEKLLVNETKHRMLILHVILETWTQTFQLQLICIVYLLIRGDFVQLAVWNAVAVKQANTVHLPDEDADVDMSCVVFVLQPLNQEAAVGMSRRSSRGSASSDRSSRERRLYRQGSYGSQIGGSGIELHSLGSRSNWSRTPSGKSIRSRVATRAEYHEDLKPQLERVCFQRICHEIVLFAFQVTVFLWYDCFRFCERFWTELILQMENKN